MKKKKPKNTIADQKLRQAQSINNFLQKLEYVCDVAAGEGAYSSIPAEYKIQIYKFRGSPLKVRHTGDSHINSKDIKELESYLHQGLKEGKMTLRENDERTVSFADYFYVVNPLWTVVCKEDSLFEGQRLFDDLNKYHQEQDNVYCNSLEHYIMSTCLFLSDFRNKWTYDYNLRFFLEEWLNLNEYNGASRQSLSWRLYQKGDFRLHQEVTIGVQEIESRHFIVNNEKRTGIRLVWWHFDHKDRENKIAPVDINLSRIEPNTSFGGLKIPVYIQSHAIDRMLERLHFDFSNQALLPLVQKIFTTEIIPLSEKRFLMAYYLYGFKCGYLLAQYIDGCLLIRTFLFMTNNGTPEGQKLEEQTRLLKEDRKYLNIDSLRGLLNSDLLKNNEAQRIFINAGCGSLIKLCRKIEEFRKEKRSKSNDVEKERKFTNFLSGLTEYIKTDNEETITKEEKLL